eukprot:TRINITY_DN1455_c0_g1_i9.p1 TRINITY_DN1455_c0_g1~~TRINITY_DN1455_c0_g1_i9.p1  ORF type:complete len:218 (+),score=46.04 TRINITY_DN1455_c0_g1_i9:341-994(+)
MSDMEEEDYGFEYETDDDEEEDVAIENAYYAAKGLLHTDPAGALTGFEGVIELEGTPGGWGFKALKQIVKLHFRQGDYSAMLTRYSELLGYIRSAVTRNVSEKVINSILDYVSTAQSAQQVDLLHPFTKPPSAPWRRRPTSGSGSKPTSSSASFGLTVASTGVWPRCLKSSTAAALATTAKTTRRRARSCSRCLRWRSSCIRPPRITSGSRRCTSGR